MYCEAIGSMRAAAWYHDGQRIRRGIVLVIVAFLQNATIEYSSESLYVSVFLCVCVFCMTTQKEIDHEHEI